MTFAAPASVTFRPDVGETTVSDLIRGETTFRHVHLDDPVEQQNFGRESGLRVEKSHDDRWQDRTPQCYRCCNGQSAGWHASFAGDLRFCSFEV